MHLIQQNKMIRILFIGDIVGQLGRKTVANVLPTLKEERAIDFVIANGENATHGRGLNKRHYEQLIEFGIDVITLGNHYDDQEEIRLFIEDANEIIRPYNLVEHYPGEGSKIFKTKDGTKLRVSNVLTQAFMKDRIISPYAAINEIIEKSEPMIHIVDLHGEATSEKQAIGWLFAGKVSAVIGTHTHVQTNDARILENHTGFMCDVGMCGDNEGIIGVEKESVINKMWFDPKTYYEYRKNGPAIFNGVILEIDKKTFATTRIETISINLDVNE